ncbi:hemin ABC transporter substrate-binding protein [Bartonella sp. HY406]|uniref:heme/hemin ABC transporter substrate-binding protein n=1 Tax=Bartonella sp. HY406 TaxID=2979331 RepID=UPI0021C9F64D|nr:ABC transporter substrate-binding protein [Bartonella sp. HY406]UXN03340.1 ABC transporter substrate-binding protein [Bartonella sp. HY406]
MIKYLLRIVLLLSAFLTFQVNLANSAEPAQLSETPINEKPVNERLVVIGSGLIETIFALGAGDEIIGRDTASTYPEQAKAIADIGFMRALSPESILSLNPQKIIMSKGSGPATSIELLKKSSVPLIIIDEEFSQKSVMQKIQELGQYLNRQNEAKALAESVNRQFDELTNYVNKIEQKKRVLFIMSVRNGRIMAAGQNTGANGMINLAGGINPVQYDGYKLINDEAIIELAPDVILTMNYNGMAVTSEEILSVPALRSTPAGKNQAFFSMEALYLMNFGPRTAKAALELSKKIYP